MYRRKYFDAPIITKSVKFVPHVYIPVFLSQLEKLNENLGKIISETKTRDYEFKDELGFSITEIPSSREDVNFEPSELFETKLDDFELGYPLPLRNYCDNIDDYDYLK